MSPNANNSGTKRKQTNDHDHNYLYEIAYVLFLEFLQMIEKPIFNLTEEDCHRHWSDESVKRIDLMVSPIS